MTHNVSMTWKTETQGIELQHETPKKRSSKVVKVKFLL